MLELEKTYLAKQIPADLKDCEFKEIIDVYIPKSQTHPQLRLRKHGNQYELTKKEPVDDTDMSQYIEQTIRLSLKEFEALNKLEGKRLRKLGYYYDWHGYIAEFDIFQDDLKGLVLIDFEFNSPEEKDNFQMPEFCLVDVTQKTFIAGGMLCGKKYTDIAKELNRLNYIKL